MLTLQNQNLTLCVDPFGAQMMELGSKQGTQFLWNGDKQYWPDRAPVLFPYVARLTDGCYTLCGERYSMDIHGFAKDSVFTIEEQSSDSVTFCLRQTPETLRQYPFRFTFRVRYALRGWTVHVTYSVCNEDEKELPFGIGGHPGFRVPLTGSTGFEDYKLCFSQPCLPDRIGFTGDCYLNSQTECFPLEDDTTIRLRHELFDEDAIVLKNMARCVSLCSEKTGKSVTVAYPQMPYLGSGDCGDEKNLLVNVLHNLRRFFPDRRGRSRLNQKRQNADAEPCGIEPAPRIFPRWRKLRQVVGCVQRCSSFSFPDAKSRRPVQASARNKIQFLYAFEHL